MMEVACGSRAVASSISSSPARRMIDLLRWCGSGYLKIDYNVLEPMQQRAPSGTLPEQHILLRAADT